MLLVIIKLNHHHQMGRRIQDRILEDWTYPLVPIRIYRSGIVEFRQASWNHIPDRIYPCLKYRRNKSIHHLE